MWVSKGWDNNRFDESILEGTYNYTYLTVDSHNVAWFAFNIFLFDPVLHYPCNVLLYTASESLLKADFILFYFFSSLFCKALALSLIWYSGPEVTFYSAEGLQLSLCTGHVQKVNHPFFSKLPKPTSSKNLEQNLEAYLLLPVTSLCNIDRNQKHLNADTVTRRQFELGSLSFM